MVQIYEYFDSRPIDTSRPANIAVHWFPQCVAKPRHVIEIPIRLMLCSVSQTIYLRLVDGQQNIRAKYWHDNLFLMTGSFPKSSHQRWWFISNTFLCILQRFCSQNNVQRIKPIFRTCLKRYAIWNIALLHSLISGLFQNDDYEHHMMTSWKHFPRYWPFMRGHRWLPIIKADETELWCFFDLRLNKRMSKQSRCWWFETPSRPLWRQCNENLF